VYNGMTTGGDCSGALAVKMSVVVCPLAIMDDGARQASRSAMGKGDFCPTHQRPKVQGERFDISPFIQ
jgi:hypothetical protein